MRFSLFIFAKLQTLRSGEEAFLTNIFSIRIFWYFRPLKNYFMKNILTILSLMIISLISAQAPPPPSMPTNENKVLIDELIKVTEFENYFNSYCKNKVEQAAKENNWDDKKKQEIIKSIHFSQFTDNIYNNFARNTKEDLEETISLIKKLNQKRNLSSTKLIVSNFMIQNNLDGYVRSLLRGDYVFLNK